MRSIFKRLVIALAAVLSLMVMFVATAQAANLFGSGELGDFRVLGLKTLVAGTQFRGTLLHSVFLIPSKNAYILCDLGQIAAGQGLNAEEILFILQLSRCLAFNDTTKAALGACPIEGEPLSKQIDVSMIGQAVLHEEKLYVLFKGDGIEGLLATIKFGPECGIGVKVKVSGSIAAEVDNGELKTEHLLTFSESIQKLLGNKMLYGASEAFLNGVLHMKLWGIHTSCAWAVV